MSMNITDILIGTSREGDIELSIDYEDELGDDIYGVFYLDVEDAEYIITEMTSAIARLKARQSSQSGEQQ